MMAVTIRDIANHVGKSITTVSRALNDFDDVAPATKEQVRAAARELGYAPNSLAQRLQKRTSDTIGLVMPTAGPRFSDPFFSELLAGVGNAAARLGYDLLVATRAPGESEVATYESGINTQRVDGFIVVRTRRDDARINLLRRRGFPFVAFGRVEGPLDFAFVDEDGVAGMAAIVRHLHRLGHRRLACIAPPADLMFTQHRLAGVRTTWQELGHPPTSLQIIEADLTQRGGYHAACTLLDAADQARPTAICACNDLMAIGAMTAAQERGLQVGVDLSVTGFDNTPMAEHSHPPLTTVDQPIHEIGGMLCELLVRRLHDEQAAPEQILLTPALIVRSSTGPPPGA